ncbi:23S rRNA (adenine(2030)-N(6))-methyltransferase RlmJ [Fodinicurvata sp. EGI_FJ10296]|uniref:23S rRNA (adenine(2030)-N(6))-methyltransferase RlmJ n=1 Tax=Fodinicurvata sp. EGI_FJ10296 TaxID=3231908 RepID=UPI0034545FFB
MTIFDTHAGVGLYDLLGEEARRTAESDAGIGRLLQRPESPELADFLALVRGASLARGLPPGRLYPGSAEIIRQRLRPDDRLVAFELHRDDFRDLRRLMAGDARVACHCRDAYEGLPALTPPTPRRGLALIDPPFEQTDEFQRVLRCLKDVGKRWPVGVLAVWYPIKARPPVDAFLAELVRSGATGVLNVELLWRPADDPARLNGAGLAVVNAPFGLDDVVMPIVAAMADALAADPGPSVRWLVPRP